MKGPFPCHVEAHNNQVMAWSKFRLPFEMKGCPEALRFRAKLRTAVSKLDSPPGHYLHAVYSSPSQKRCDTENVLLYNVGTRCFATSTKEGMLFERAYRLSQPRADRSDVKYEHRYAYSVEEIGAALKQYLKSGRQLARWSSAPEAHGMKNCPSTWWYTMKQATIIASPTKQLPPMQFGLRLQLTVPPKACRFPANKVKPIFDGVISAFHQYDGNDVDKISERLKAQLGVDASSIKDLLVANDAAVLGKRAVVHRHGSHVQWNPQDEACVVGELVIHRNENQHEWTLAGELFEVVAV